MTIFNKGKPDRRTVFAFLASVLTLLAMVLAPSLAFADGGVKEQLLRLGLQWTATDANGGESWMNYGAQLQATIDVPDSTDVTFTDMGTGQRATVDLDRLRTLTEIRTVTSAPVPTVLAGE